LKFERRSGPPVEDSVEFFKSFLASLECCLVLSLSFPFPLADSVDLERMRRETLIGFYIWAGEAAALIENAT